MAFRVAIRTARLGARFAAPALLVSAGIAALLTAGSVGHAPAPPSSNVLGAKVTAATATAGNSGCGNGNGGSTGTKDCSSAGKAFTMSSSIDGLLYPGLQRVLTITVSNPNAQAIQVTSVAPAVGNPVNKPGCLASWVTANSYSYSGSGSTVIAPGNGETTLKLPIVLNDRPQNQDACRNATFPISLTGSAVQVP